MSSNKKIILFGAPGSGKGTQAEMLANEFKLSRISLGDILREEVAKDSILGREVKGCMEKGLLVSDDLVSRVIEENIGNDGFILDGYPRNIDQARNLEKILEKKENNIDVVLYLDIDEEIILDRLAKRGRGDDNLEVIRKRWQVFQNECFPILDFYREKDKLVTVDGRGEKLEIFNRIKAQV
jgi:adenylate kinase